MTKDGHVYSCSADKTARLHKLADGKAVRTFSGHKDWVYAVAYHEASKRLATGTYDGEIRIFNAEDGKVGTTFTAAPGYKLARLGGTGPQGGRVSGSEVTTSAVSPADQRGPLA